MAEPPGRLPLTSEERQRVITEGQAGGSLRGATGWGRRADDDARLAPVKVNGVAVVKHYDDDSLPRPLATIVFWMGAADPINKAPQDVRYPANDFDA